MMILFLLKNRMLRVCVLQQKQVCEKNLLLLTQSSVPQLMMICVQAVFIKNPQSIGDYLAECHLKSGTAFPS